MIIDYSPLIQKLKEHEQRLSKLEGKRNDRKLIPLSEFLDLGYMSPPCFYQKAPKGEIAGAVKIGYRWFVDHDVFLKSLGEGY
jgi:hypothetical protein